LMTSTYLDAGLLEYSNPAESSIQLKSQLSSIKDYKKHLVKSNMATVAANHFTYNNSSKKGKKFISDMSKMCLQSYNATVENCILTVKAGKGD
ncbi:hypothetical protein, partial [Pseudoalteromonas sp. SYSU M81241]